VELRSEGPQGSGVLALGDDRDWHGEAAGKFNAIELSSLALVAWRDWMDDHRPGPGASDDVYAEHWVKYQTLFHEFCRRRESAYEMLNRWVYIPHPKHIASPRYWSRLWLMESALGRTMLAAIDHHLLCLTLWMGGDDDKAVAEANNRHGPSLFRTCGNALDQTLRGLIGPLRVSQYLHADHGGGSGPSDRPVERGSAGLGHARHGCDRRPCRPERAPRPHRPSS
jgi:hypothetical protein